MSLGIALLFVCMIFIMLTLFFQKRRMDATDKLIAGQIEVLWDRIDKIDPKE